MAARAVAGAGDVHVLAGVTAGERFGRQVANAGDVDGNGAADLVVGADMAYRYGRTRAGELTFALLPGPAPKAPPPVDPQPTPTPTPTASPTAVPTAMPTPTPSPAPVVERPIPTITDRSLTATRRGRLLLTVRCAATTAACPGRLTLTLAGKRRTATYTAPAGETVRVRVTLTAAQRRSLARHSRLRGKLAFALADGTTRTLKLTVRGPRR